jgi:tetratricopeptide (TPR) repeat protein
MMAFYRCFLVLVTACVILAGASAGADQRDDRLPALFKLLKTTDMPDQAQQAEVQIWSIWTRHGDDEKANFLMEQGMGLMGGGHLKEALGVFHKLVASNPEFAEAWNKRATVLYLMERLEESVTDIHETLKLEPNHFGALSGLGLIYLSVDELKGALKAFKAALEINPHMPGPKFRVKQLEEHLKGEKL